MFPLSSVTGSSWKRQIGTATFSTSTLPTPALSLFAGSVATVAFGSYASPDYETAAKVIPPYGNADRQAGRAGDEPGAVHAVRSRRGTEPAGGWPVAIFGHGFTDSKNGAPWAVASLARAHAGIATIAINVVGHGFGPLGTYTVATD